LVIQKLNDNVGQSVHHIIQQINNTVPVFGGNRIKRVQPQLIKIGKKNFLLNSIYFINDIKGRLINCAKNIDDFPVKRRDPVFAVQQQNDHIRICNGLMHLETDFIGEIISFGKSTGVYQGKFNIIPACVPIMTIPRNSRKIIHQGIFAAGDTVKQGRFTHIGTTDNGDNGFHKINA